MHDVELPLINSSDCIYIQIRLSYKRFNMCAWVSALAVVSLIDQKTCQSAEECGAGIQSRFTKSVEVNCKVTCGNCHIENIYNYNTRRKPTWFIVQLSPVPQNLAIFFSQYCAKSLNDVLFGYFDITLIKFQVLLKCRYDNVQDISLDNLEIMSCALWTKGPWIQIFGVNVHLNAVRFQLCGKTMIKVLNKLWFLHHGLVFMQYTA